MALNSRQITTSIIDAQRFPEFTDTFKIRSVPMIIVDRSMMINEALAPDKLAELVLSRESEDFKEKALSSLVSFGNIDESLKMLSNLTVIFILFLFKNVHAIFQLMVLT